MTAADILAALELPPAARIDQRVPKKLLLEKGSPTAADRRAIADGIEGLLWIAALKPTTIAVPAWRDGTQEYPEIAVLSLSLRAGAKAPRLTALVHRAIPYPVLLIAEQPPAITISAARKRWSENEADKTVLAEDVITAVVDPTDAKTAACWPDFRAALSLSRQPRGNFLALYQGWIDTLLTWQAARRTGRFTLPRTPAGAAARRAALAASVRLEAEIHRLRLTAAKENQMRRRVDLNLAIQRLEAEMARHRTGLSGEPSGEPA